MSASTELADYAEGEAPWSEDEQLAEQAKACRSRRKHYGENHCDEKDGTCAECEYDAQKFLRKKYPAPATQSKGGDGNG